MLIRYVIIALIYFGFHSTFLAQNSVVVQKYEYEDDTVKVVLICNRNELERGQTMNLKFDIKNISNDNIFVFRRPYMHYNISKDSIYGSLVIEYGEGYVHDIVMWDTMQILKPRQEIHFDLQVGTDKLQKIGYKEYFDVNLGLGYIKSFDAITESKIFMIAIYHM